MITSLVGAHFRVFPAVVRVAGTGTDRNFCDGIQRPLPGIQAHSGAWIRHGEKMPALDKLCLKFGEVLRRRFLSQGEFESRSIATTLDFGRDVLSLLPRDELHRAMSLPVLVSGTD